MTEPVANHQIRTGPPSSGQIQAVASSDTVSADRGPASTRPNRRVTLVPAILGAFLGASVMVGVFGIKHTQIFRCREYALGVGNVGMPPSPSPSVYEAWDEEDRKHAIEAAKQLPQDQFWRAYAGPWSNLDRCSVEGKRGLVFLGACVGGLVGGCFSLLIASIRPSRRRREWYDSLPLTGTCFGALLVNGMLRLAPAPWDYQHRPPRNDFEEITTMIVMGAFIGAVAGYSGRFVFGWKTRREELKGKKTAFLEDAGQMKK